MVSSRNQPFPWGALVVLVCAYGAVYLLFLGLPLIGGSSEAREAHVIDVIVREGAWALPLRNGIVPSKPILFHWVGACMSWLVGGVSEFSVRLPSLVFGLGLMILSALVAFRMAVLNRAAECSFSPRHVALLTAALLPLTYGFHSMAGLAMVDMCFAFFTWCSLVSVLSTDEAAWRDHRNVSRGARALFWSSCAAAVLTRGPIGVVLPVVMVCAPVTVLFGLRTVVRELVRPSVGWLAFALPFAWYYTAYAHGGDAFVERQLLFENVRRFFGGEHVNTQPWWFYGPSLLRSAAPWSVVVLVCWLAEARRPSLDSGYGVGSKVVLSVPLISLAVSVALFSCSAGKRHSYMVPLFPLLVIQLALVGVNWFERGGGRLRRKLGELSRRLEVVAALLGVAILIACGVFLSVLPLSHPLATEMRAALASAMPRFGSLIVVAILPCVVWGMKSLRGSLFCVWFAVTALLTGITSTGSTVKAHLKNFKGMSGYWLAHARQGDQLTVIKEPFDEYFDPILWYVHRRVDVIRDVTTPPPCSDERLYLVHREWFDRSAGSMQGQVSLAGTLQEMGSAVKEEKGRELVTFRCFPHVAPTPPPSSGGVLETSVIDRPADAPVPPRGIVL